MPKSTWKELVKERDCYKCKICNTKGSKNNPLTVHHLLPKSRNGKASAQNGVCWCWECHKLYHEEWGLTKSDEYGNPVEPRYTKAERRKHRKKKHRKR